MLKNLKTTIYYLVLILICCLTLTSSSEAFTDQKNNSSSIIETTQAVITITDDGKDKVIYVDSKELTLEDIKIILKYNWDMCNDNKGKKDIDIDIKRLK